MLLHSYSDIWLFSKDFLKKMYHTKKKDTHLSASVSKNTLKNFEEFVSGLSLYHFLSSFNSISKSIQLTSPERSES